MSHFFLPMLVLEGPCSPRCCEKSHEVPPSISSLILKIGPPRPSRHSIRPLSYLRQEITPLRYFSTALSAL